jgi:hypothetical protein
MIRVTHMNSAGSFRRHHFPAIVQQGASMTKILQTAAVALLAAGLLATPAAAQQTSAWIDACNSKEELVKCYAYASGLANGLKLWQLDSPSTAIACIPEGVGAGELVEAGKKYDHDHPMFRKVHAARFLAYAFREAWPCK